MSFRTYGDYVLKAPFLYVLYSRFPDARVVVVTNRKGGEVYPLLDTRLEILVLDHDTPKAVILPKLWKLGVADLLYVTDVGFTPLVLAMAMRARKKIGWYQNLSRLYGESGFFDWTSTPGWLSRMARIFFRPAKLRQPEEKYEGYVDLELLDSDGDNRPLAAFRGLYARPGRARSVDAPYVYCATEAGWKARQLTAAQWGDILAYILERFPEVRILVHGSDEVVRRFAATGRVSSHPTGSVGELFDVISGAALVIAPDSFALHASSLYDIPAIGYFGPAHPHRFRPTGPLSHALFHCPPCSPCLQRRGESPCVQGFAQCMSLAQITVEDFREPLERVLAHGALDE
jgi:ADP-heptose:LPS heptosyltransferase